jgi:hypothetical protein
MHRGHPTRSSLVRALDLRQATQNQEVESYISAIEIDGQKESLRKYAQTPEKAVLANTKVVELASAGADFKSSAPSPSKKEVRGWK